MRSIMLALIIVCAVWSTNAAAQTTRWALTTRVDPMTDKTHAYVQISDVNGLAELRIGCANNTKRYEPGEYGEYVALDVDRVIDAGQYGAHIKTRLDTLPAVSELWDVSKTFHTAFAPDSTTSETYNPFNMTKVVGPVSPDTLAVHARLTVEVPIYVSNPAVFRFNLSGAKAALAKLRAKCKRPTTQQPPPPRPTTQQPPSTTWHDTATVSTEGVAFPFPEYLQNITTQVLRRWQRPARETPLEVELSFFVHRDGSVTNLQFIRRSGNFAFDLEAQGAVEESGRFKAFGALPDGWTSDVLFVRFHFSGQRQ